MDKLFDINSKFMQLLYKLTDMLWLNLLTVFCSLPIFTIGAARAGLYYALGKLGRDEGSATRDFFRGFRSNFGKATKLWLCWLAAAAILVFAAFFYLQRNVPGLLFLGAGALLLLAALLWVLSFPWVTALQVTFENTVKGTAKNAFILGFTNLLPTLLLGALELMPIALWLVKPYYFWMLGILWICGWISITTFVNVRITGKILDAHREKEEKT